MASPLDEEVTTLARRIAELGEGEQAKVFRMSWWSERMLTWAMSHPSFKTQLFRFVDVFPATTDDADVLRHIREYFDEGDAPRIVDLGVDIAEHVPGGEHLSASVARRNIARMAQQFVVGTDGADALAGLHRLWRAGSAFTVDLLGEKTVTEAEADRYAGRVQRLLTTLVDGTARWAPDDHLERDDLGPLPRANISIKPTALASHYAPLTADEGIAQARTRLLPILREAAESDAFVWFDMEHHDVKDLTLRLFRELLDDPSLDRLHAGIVVQAYLKDALDDIADLIVWGSERNQRPGTQPISVRLVKGAYWDAETITARAEGWPVPVFALKEETDANYERCARLLHDHHGVVRAAFGSHNLRSLAYAITYARSQGIPDSGYELQMLYGMAEPVHAAIKRLGLRLRVYAPVGELVPGMAYLVRRLLENTSNESFVRARFAEGKQLDELVEAPSVTKLPAPEPPTRRPPTDGANPGPYHHEPLNEWRRTEVRTIFGAAVEEVLGELGGVRPALIGGERVMTAARFASTDPAQPDRLVAEAARCGPSEVDGALSAAAAAAEAWAATAPEARSAVLFRAAEWMRERRARIAALEVFEAGKPWKEADADVCEAIDFCEYYGREQLRLAAGGAVLSPPGEHNELTYRAKGVVAVIAPWNFPLAIPTGMTVAALVTGNPVVLKPAEQTPATAMVLADAFAAAGLPPGVLNVVHGFGEEVGAALVEDPRTALIAFTGSKGVGLAITRAAAEVRPGQRHIKRVIAELGGKNALIVDADADLDAAVPAILQSAFGFSGQKCSAASRLIVDGAIHDELVDRLVGAARQLIVDHPRHAHTQVGPVIDAEARDRIRGAIEQAASEGDVVLAPADPPAQGWFVPPVIVDDVAPDATVAREEIFGPVLAIHTVADIGEAIAVANATDYALTAGILSRSPVNIRRAAAELRAGNVYVNRSTTGAVVGRQPFGGYGLSGVGSKAGGPDYLLQFVDPRVVTENTLRQGFAPEEAGA